MWQIYVHIMLDFRVAFVQISVVHENGIVSFPKIYSIEKGQSWCTRDLFFFFSSFPSHVIRNNSWLLYGISLFRLSAPYWKDRKGQHILVGVLL